VTWVLNATGQCASEEDERALVEGLNKLLSNPKSGTIASGLNGDHHRGPAHGLPKEPSARQRASRGDEE
jgi:hypothetical protein